MLAHFFCSFLAACGSIPESVSAYGPLPDTTELNDVPFHPQERFQCGPAALLTVLEYSGVAVKLPTLVERVYLPGREGSLQAELIAQTRAQGRVPYRIEGSLSALRAELDAGRPVLVLQNLGVGWWPRWHYAVVVAVNRDSGEVVLRSGVERRRIAGVRTFLHTWRRSNYWGFVVLRPGELPADPRPGRYFEALAGLEETGHVREAKIGWESALRHWPDSTVALFGLGNAEFMLKNWAAAEKAYRRLLAVRPGLAAVRNNLALSLLHQQRLDAARAEATRARQQSAENPGLLAEIRRTIAEIEAAGDSP